MSNLSQHKTGYAALGRSSGKQPQSLPRIWYLPNTRWERKIIKNIKQPNPFPRRESFFTWL